MSEDNKALVRRLDEAFFKQDFGTFDELLADDFVDHNPIPDSPGGVEGFKQTARTVMGGFPDMDVKTTDVIAEDDRVVHFWICEGTHDGEFMAMSPSGKRVTFTGIEIWRIADGQIAERWGVVDNMDLLEKTGNLPAIEEAAR
jgi:steroid delta-isomerase-like uncharacterized protein